MGRGEGFGAVRDWGGKGKNTAVTPHVLGGGEVLAITCPDDLLSEAGGGVAANGADPVLVAQSPEPHQARAYPGSAANDQPRIPCQRRMVHSSGRP